ncbi:hypothetical protein BA6E_125586 [Bacteroidales bacterium 6E]|nr:hypothetical protein BA6E_125586 [Bacteroidales bacterium 6E]
MRDAESNERMTSFTKTDATKRCHPFVEVLNEKMSSSWREIVVARFIALIIIKQKSGGDPLFTVLFSEFKVAVHCH